MLRKLPRIRFTIRCVAAAFVLFGVCLAVCAWKYRVAQRDLAEVARVRSWGADVRMTDPVEYPCSGMLRRMLGAPAVDGVVYMSLSGLMAQPHQETVTPPMTPYIDRHGKTRPFAETVQILRKGSVRDADLALLRRFHTVQSLDLSFTAVTDQGLCQLSGLQSLEHLNLMYTTVTGSGLSHLPAKQRLKTLYLRNTGISDREAQAVLPEFIALESLDLESTHISDATLDCLATCKHLKDVSLVNTDVTIAGVTTLVNAHHIERLQLNATYLTEEEVDQLGECHPRLDIEF